MEDLKKEKVKSKFKIKKLLLVLAIAIFIVAMTIIIIIGLNKKYKNVNMCIMEYNVNGGEFSSFIKNIGETKSNIKLRLEKEIKKINTTYDYPLDIVELDNTLTEIQTLNSDLIKEKQRIENYKVVEKDWEKYIIR